MQYPQMPSNAGINMSQHGMQTAHWQKCHVDACCSWALSNTGTYKGMRRVHARDWRVSVHSSWRWPGAHRTQLSKRLSELAWCDPLWNKVMAHEIKHSTGYTRTPPDGRKAQQAPPELICLCGILKESPVQSADGACLQLSCGWWPSDVSAAL